MIPIENNEKMKEGLRETRSNQLSEVSFKEPHWRDVPCIFLFLLFLIGFVVIATMDLIDYNKTKCFRSLYGDPRVALFEPEILGILGVCILLTFAFAGLYYCLAAVWTKQFIGISMAVELCVSLGTAIFYLAQRQWLSGAFSVVWLVFSGMLYWAVRRFNKTAFRQLAVALQIADRNPSLIVISCLGALLSAAWSVLVGSVALASFGKAITPECSANHTVRTECQFLVVIFYLGITNYLFTESLKAVIRVSICYTYGWWCFVPSYHLSQNGNGPSNQIAEFPSIPYTSWLGLLAGITYSFGSVCFSSIWIALMRLVTLILGAWSQTLMVDSVNMKASEDISLVILAWLLSIFVAHVDSALTHFTNYILVFIAVDNVSYLEGFKQAWKLVTKHGLGAVIRDCLAAGALTFGPWCIGMAVALCSYIYMRFIHPYPYEGAFFVCCYILMVSTQISSIILTVISSGVQTLFVAMSSEPERVKQVHPHTFNLLSSMGY